MIPFDCNVFDIALTLFLVTNPIGNSPAILALVKDLPFARQRFVLLREALFAFLIALFFQQVGEGFLAVLGISDYSLRLCGGTILFLVGLSMIFPNHSPTHKASEEHEPYIVPIATPLLSGAGLMSITMTFSAQVDNNLMMVSALMLAWVGVFIVLGTAPYLLRLFGKRGLLALEQFMGLILVMLACSMFVRGLAKFIQTFKG